MLTKLFLHYCNQLPNYIQQHVLNNTVEYKQKESTFAWDCPIEQNKLVETTYPPLNNEQIVIDQLRYSILKTSYPKFNRHNLLCLDHEYPRMYRKESFDNKVDPYTLISVKPLSTSKQTDKRRQKKQLRLVKLAARKNNAKSKTKVIRLPRIEVNDYKLSPYYCSNNKTKHKASWGTDNPAIPDSHVSNRLNSSHQFKITLQATGKGTYDVVITYRGDSKRIKESLDSHRLLWQDGINIGSFDCKIQLLSINRTHTLFTEKFTTIQSVQDWVLANSPKPLQLLGKTKIQRELHTNNVPAKQHGTSEKSPYTTKRQQLAKKVKYC